MNDKPFCKNHDVACGNYNCNYADVVNNTIVCNAKICNHQSTYTPIKLTNDNEKDYREAKLKIGSVYGKSVYDLLSNMSDEDYPF